MSDYSVAPRNVVKDFIETQDFDKVVIIMHDSHTGTIKNWYHVSGHPVWWTESDLSSIAQQMSEFTSQELKKDVNTGQRVVKYAGPKIVKIAAKDKRSNWVNLWCIALALPRNDHKRLYLTGWFTTRMLGLELRLMPTKEEAFAIAIDIGPFCFEAYVRP